MLSASIYEFFKTKIYIVCSPFVFVFKNSSFCLIELFIFLIVLLCLLIPIAYYTLVERKVMGSIQHREGPGVVGFWGLLQPLSDGLKLFIKEPFNPVFAQVFLFYVSPILALFLSIFGWAGTAFLPIYSFLDFNVIVLFFFAVSSFNVYSVVLAGWSSNSKYALLGAIRSTAQMIAYEVSLGFVLIMIVAYAGSSNLTTIIFAQRNCWFMFLIPFLFFMFYVSIVAETNRAPFDLPEAEAEIVAGYHVEYGGMGFSLFFLGEYGNMILMSFLVACFFGGGWNLIIIDFYGTYFYSYILAIKTFIVALSLVVIRAAFPRYRYDKLMALGWLIFLPLTFGFLFLHIAFFFFLGIMPVQNDFIYLDLLLHR